MNLKQIACSSLLLSLFIIGEKTLCHGYDYNKTRTSYPSYTVTKEEAFVGQEIRFELDAWMLGYQWDVVQSSKQLRLIDSERQNDRQIITFVPLQSGEATVTFEYHETWASDLPPTKVRKYIIKVSGDLY